MGTFLENKVCTLKIKFFKKNINEIWTPNEIFFTEKKLERFDQFLTQKNDFESTNFANFEEVVHTFGRSDDDMI